MLIPISDAIADVGIFGGSGFYRWGDGDGAGTEVLELDTPYGPPAGPITVAAIGDRRVAFLPRHGPEHTFAAHRVPYRANVWALASLGVASIVAPCAVGALQPDLAPGDFVVVDQLVDRTWGRDDTFHDVGRGHDVGPTGPAVGAVHHQPFADPYDPDVRSALLAGARAVGAPVHDGATMVVINGPRFSTRAESAWFRAMGWHVVNMTGYPEAVLAAEAGVPYAAIALVTDRDAGLDGGPAVTMSGARHVLRSNAAVTRDLLAAAVPRLP